MVEDVDTGRPLRVAYVIRDLRLGGGTENHLMQLFEHLDRRRFIPSLCLLREHGELLTRVRDLGVEVTHGNMPGSLVSPRLLSCIARFARAFRADGIDVVHTYLPRGELVGAVAGRLAGVPVLVCSKRGCHYRRGTEAIGCRIANSLADVVLANARAVRDFVAADEGCPLDKMQVIENGVDAQRFSPVADPRAYKARLGLNPEQPVVGTITRARIRKGYEEFIRACGAISQSRPDVQFVVVGQDTREQAPQDLIAALGIADRLHLLGLRQDIPNVLAAYDVFVLSSHDEGMSNAIMEAMSVGKPVVATDVGGGSEMVSRGVTGLLVPPKVVAPLAEAILQILNTPELGAQMGRHARRVVDERFAVEVMVHRMEAIYESLWSAKRGPKPRGAGQRAAQVAMQ